MEGCVRWSLSDLAHRSARPSCLAGANPTGLPRFRALMVKDQLQSRLLLLPGVLVVDTLPSR